MSKLPPTNPVPEAEGGGELIERLNEECRQSMVTIAEGRARAEAAEAQLAEFRRGLEVIARGAVPNQRHGHHLAHRHAVKTARALLALSSEAPPVVCGGGDGSSGAESGISPAAPARTETLSELESAVARVTAFVDHVESRHAGALIFHSGKTIRPAEVRTILAALAEPGSQERAAVVPAAEQAGGEQL